MKNQEGDIDLANRVVGAFVRETGFPVRLEGDGVLVAGEKRFTCWTQKWAQQANLGFLIHEITRLTGQGILLADYVNPAMCCKLKDQGIPFMDAAGNAYFVAPGIHIFIMGNRNIHPQEPQQGAVTRAFNGAGLKIVFAFLCQPDLVNKPFRDIAKKANVALGTVGWVMKELVTAGFIYTHGKRRELVDREKLMDRWVREYPERLRPKLHLGDFEAPNHDWWKGFCPENFDAYWGGETAAALLTRYLKPAVATVYVTKEARGRLIAAARLRKAHDQGPGVIHLYEAFCAPVLNGGTIGHAVLVYADLIATADARNREAAEMVYRDFIKDKI